ncbi:MAG: ROK family protein, partial [Bacteroidota bacterium]
EAAVAAFQAFAVVAGDALANAITLVDGLIVIGGGLSNAYQLFLNDLVTEMNHPFNTLSGEPLDRLEVKAFNLEDPVQCQKFYHTDTLHIPVPFTNRVAIYHPVKKTGVGISRLGTSRAVSIGAYAYALYALDH